MTGNGGPTRKKPGRLSPEELAGEVARRLRLDRGGHRRRRFDIVSATRIAMIFGVVLLGAGVVFASSLIGRLIGFETTGTVLEETPVFGCPGEIEIGVMFTGETIQLVGRSEDGMWYAIRDERGPGDVVYGDATHISPGEHYERLLVRNCDPRSATEVAAASVTTDADDENPTTTVVTSLPTTTLAGETTTTTAGAGPTAGRPPRRGTASPGTTTTTTTTRPESTTTTRPDSTTTTRPVTTTTRPGSTTTTTSLTTTTSPATTSTTLSTTTTTLSTTTTTAETTTTTAETTTTTAETTTTTAETTTTDSTVP